MVVVVRSRRSSRRSSSRSSSRSTRRCSRGSSRHSRISRPNSCPSRSNGSGGSSRT